MDRQAYIDKIKFMLTGGGVLDLEVDDSSIGKAVDYSLMEVQRYIDSTRLVTVPYTRCIDMKEYNASSVSRVYRATSLMSTGYAEDKTKEEGVYYIDPVYASMWNSLYGYGNMYNSQNYIYNILSYNTTMQIGNTLSTDLQFIYDKESEKLYVTCNYNQPSKLTIEYVPRYNKVEEVTSDFWSDILYRMALAYTKIIVGNIRKKYKSGNALWELDTSIGDEGANELNELRSQLRDSAQLVYGID